METQLAYCSACDRQIRVVARTEVGGSTDLADVDPQDLVCLEYGESCTGELCPVFRVPVRKMRENYERRAEERSQGRGEE